MSEHWSSPNGCHPDCPACLEERRQFISDRIESLNIVWDLAAQNVITEQQLQEDFNCVEIKERQDRALEIVDNLIDELKRKL